jgi:hypothetical protein
MSQTFPCELPLDALAECEVVCNLNLDDRRVLLGQPGPAYTKLRRPGGKCPVGIEEGSSNLFHSRAFWVWQLACIQFKPIARPNLDSTGGTS